MIQRESHFQYLVALAVAGQISDTELEELMDHTASCGACSQRMLEMESASVQLFLTLAPQIKKARISSRLQEQFLIRATHSCARIAATSSGFRHSNLLHFAALLVAVCLISGLGWKRITQGSSRQEIDPKTSVKVAGPSQLSSMTDSGPASLEIPVAEHSITGPNRRSHRARSSSKGPILQSSGMREVSRIAAQPVFRFDSALFINHSAAVNAQAKLSHFLDVSDGYFSPRSVGLEPSFFTPAIWSPKTSSIPDQRVFQYSATLASISLQDDHAVLELKSRVRDFSFSNALALTHLR